MRVGCFFLACLQVFGLISCVLTGVESGEFNSDCNFSHVFWWDDLKRNFIETELH